MTDLDADAIFHDLLTLRSWVAFDVDADGNVLAGHDELGSTQLVEVAPDGTRTPLTDLPGRVMGRYVPGRREVLVQHDHGGDELWQVSLLRLDGLDHPAHLDDLEPVVADPEHFAILADVTPDSLVFSTNRRNGTAMDLVVRSLADGSEHVVLTDGGYLVQSAVSHDARTVASTALTLLPNSTVVRASGPDGVRDLTDATEPGDHFLLGWSADDEAVLLSSEHGRDLAALQRVGLDGTWTVLVADDDHEVRGRLSPDGRTLLAVHHAEGLDRLVLHDVDGTRRADVDLAPAVLNGVVWAADGSSLVLSVMWPTVPSSIVVVDATTGAARTVVDGADLLPQHLRGRLVDPTVHRIPTRDGERVECFVHAGAVVDGLVPGAAVVHVHGGPEGEARRIFSPVIQSLALSGFTVVVPNVRGSAGRGRRWVSLDDVGLRLESVADLADLNAWLPTIGCDPGRSALWGGSYGGYMVLAGVSMQPDLWAAGVDIVGMSSLVTFLENTSD